MEKKFIKVGEKILFKPSTDGLDYDLEAGKVYNLNIERYSGDITFEVAPSLELPTKVYTTEDDERFVKKVLEQYGNIESGVLGVMLSGLKGSGKTVTVKNIANKSNLPIILIDKGFAPYQFKNLFSKLGDVEACFIFDEVDKLGEDYDDTFLLQVLDGANTTGKKLMLFTCNDEDEINQCLIDRCSRIRYWKKFDEMSASMSETILKDKLDDKGKVKPLLDFIQEKFGVISFDNVASFINEVNDYPNDSFESLFEDMNLSEK